MICACLRRESPDLEMAQGSGVTETAARSGASWERRHFAGELRFLHPETRRRDASAPRMARPFQSQPDHLKTARTKTFV
jgi:hypothetical protein